LLARLVQVAAVGDQVAEGVRAEGVVVPVAVAGPTDPAVLGCLRGYRNQPFHEELRRGAAVNFLRSLVPAGGRYPD
jgi:hypothetical protein